MSGGPTRTTSLGPALRRAAGRWTIDLTDLPLFHGLSVLSRALGERVVERAVGAGVDVDVERRVKPAENPELAALGCLSVKVVADRHVIGALARDPEQLQHHLRTVLGTLQQARWRRRLLPDAPGRRSAALVFAFRERGRAAHRFLLERVPAAHGTRRFHLRILVEHAHGRRLDLASVPHVRVDDLERREYVAGSTRIAQTLRDLVQREAERGRRTHVERQKEGSFVFRQLARGGLGHVALLHLTWSERAAGWLAEAEPARLDGVLKKALLLLEDRTVRELLHAGRTVELCDGDLRLFLDVSQQRRVLNLAFEQPRRRVDLAGYLRRMPAVARLVRRAQPSAPLAGLSVVLVHHITAEVLGVIAALRALGCDDVTVLFVRYAGDIPHEHLEALLERDDGCRSYALQSVQDPGDVEGHFVLSRQFSPLGDLDALDRRLHAQPARYLEAMTALAVHLFCRTLERGRRVLLVEDGGYLAPLLNARALAGATLGELALEHGLGDLSAGLARRRLDAVLRERLVGSVEHTRNGFDRLGEVERRYGRLARPALSIAVSRLKIDEEAAEVASGVLAAVEAVYHATGQVLSRRHPLVLGAAGAIGSRLVCALAAGRVRHRVLGLDVRPAPDGSTARRWIDLPVAARRAVDLVVGATGVSAFGAAEAEELVQHGTATTITFASGSTKTVEFRAVADWIEALAASERPLVGGRPARIGAEEIVDPQSGRLYGTAFTVRLAGRRRDVRLVFVANLTPVNFLFYGVPGEVMDQVMAQLLRAAVGLIRRATRGDPLAPRLHAVDRDIDDAALLADHAPAGPRLRRAGRSPRARAG